MTGRPPRIGCNVEGCDRKHRAKGWCRRHHARWLRYGHPEERRKGHDTQQHCRGCGRYTRRTRMGYPEWCGRGRCAAIRSPRLRRAYRRLMDQAAAFGV